ncbi:MAG TPA: alpha/beta fold hydrolase [Solirubrobacteraceae bacterium]|nr:alpha/beta fold hydrolase [Solirubrobacteraceae bacterium]
MSNDPVLLLHGQPGAASDWDHVRASIDGDARTIAFDRPGWDRRSAVRDLAGNASAARTVLDRTGIERATVVGHSLGAAVAAWLAWSSPERVSRLVLVAPAANVESLSAVDYLLATPVVGWLAGVGAMAGGGLALGAGPARRWVAEATALDDRYLQSAGRALLTPSSWRSFIREQRLLVRDLPVLERRLDQISASTTIVAGTGDRVVPLAAARRLAGQIREAELVEIEHAGHLVHLHHAGEVARAIAGGG